MLQAKQATGCIAHIDVTVSSKLSLLLMLRSRSLEITGFLFMFHINCISLVLKHCGSVERCSSCCKHNSSCFSSILFMLSWKRGEHSRADDSEHTQNNVYFTACLNAAYNHFWSREQRTNQENGSSLEQQSLTTGRSSAILIENYFLLLSGCFGSNRIIHVEQSSVILFILSYILS